MCAGVLEVPAELVNHVGSERREQLVPDDLLRSLTDLGEVRRHHDPERPRRQRTKHRSVAFEEDAELVQYLVGHDVDEYATPFQVDADREALGEIPNGPFVALPGGHVR